jgi:hypothetical protein
MTDPAPFDLSAWTYSDTAEMRVLNPSTGEPTGWTLTIAGPAHAVTLDALAGAARRNLDDARSGRDVRDLWDRWGPAIVRDVPQALQAADTSALDELLDTIRAGAPILAAKATGPSLTEFLAEAGGLKDQGGELSARDLGQWHREKRFRKRLVRDDGQNLDDATLRAWEAGYFPEAGDQRPDINALLDAIDEERRGRPRFAERNMDRAALDRMAAIRDLDRFLTEHDIDLAQASNADIRELLQRESEAGRQEGAEVFQALRPRHAVEFTRKLDALKAGTLGRGEVLDMGPTPPALKLAGLPDLPLVYKQSEAHKTLLGKHKDLIDEETLRRLPDVLRDPIMVARQDDGRFAVLIKDGRGQDVLTVIHPRAAVENRSTNLVVTTHPRWRPDAMLKAIREGRIVYRHKERSQGWFDQAQQQSSGREPILGFSDSIPTNEALGKEYFQPDGGAAAIKRGSFRFGGGKPVITLFETANRSTFMHESAHLVLEMARDLAALPDTDPAFKDDFGRILAMIGAPSAEGIATEHHETFARSWEAYLMDGKAPSDELRSVFRQFKDWLARIYREARALMGLGGREITPEVRDVMDRLLATDEEIAQARAAGHLMPAFESAAQVGWTEGEYARYRELAAEAHERAREILLARLMKDEKKKRTAEWRSLREAARADAEAEVMARKVNRLVHFLRFGERLGDPEAKVEPVKLNRQWLVERFGDAVLLSLPGGKGKGAIHAKDGAHPDVVAADWGYSSGEAMMEAILGTAVTKDGRTKYPSIKEQIEARTDELMAERHGDMLSDGSILEGAQEAIHNMDRGEVLAMELRHLRKLGGAALTDAAAARRVADAGGSATPGAQVNADEALATALDRGDDMAARLAQAEKSAARAEGPEAAIHARAARANARALREAMKVPHQVVREAARRRVEGISYREISRFAEMARYERRAGRNALAAIARKDWRAAAEFKFQELWHHYTVLEMTKAKAELDGIVKRLEPFRKKTVKRDVPPAHLINVRTLLSAFGLGGNFADPVAARQAIGRPKDGNDPASGLHAWAAGINDDPDTVGAVFLPETLTAETAIDWRDATPGQLRDLAGTVKSILKHGRENNDAARAAFAAEMQALGEHIRDHNKAGKPRSIEPGRMEKFGRGADVIFAAHRKAEFLLRELDGFQDLGAVWEAIYKPINDAANEGLVLREKATRDLKGLLDLYTPKERGRFAERIFVPEVGQSFTRMGVISLGLNMGNAENRARVLDGYGWTEAQLNAVLARLTVQDWTFAQKTWDYLETWWPKIAALEEKITGVAPPKVEAVAFTTPTGQVLRGGYYPISYDSDLTAESGRDQAAETYKAVTKGGHYMAATRHGHTKARAGAGGDRQISLSLDVLGDHLGKVIQDLTHREAVNRVGRVIRSRPVQEAIVAAKGLEGYKSLEPWLKDAAVGQAGTVANTKFDRALRHIRVGISVAEMGWSLRTAIVQPLGLLQSAARLGVARTLYFFARYLGNAAMWGKGHAEVVEKSVFMRNRTKLFDRDIADQLNKLGEGDRLYRLKESYFSFIGAMDMLVSVPTWQAAFDKGMVDFGADEAKAIDYADAVVRMTQASGLAKDLAEVQRGGEAARLFTAFYSYFSVTYNMLADAVEQADFRDPGDLARLTGQVMLIVVAPALLNEIVLNGLLQGDDEPEEKAIKAARAVGLYSLNGFVIGRDIASYILSDKNYGYSFAPAGRALQTVGDVAKQAMQGELDRALVRSAVMATGYLGHLPTRQAWRTVDYLWRHQEGETDGFSAWEALVTGYRKD